MSQALPLSQVTNSLKTRREASSFERLINGFTTVHTCHLVAEPIKCMSLRRTCLSACWLPLIAVTHCSWRIPASSSRAPQELSGPATHVGAGWSSQLLASAWEPQLLAALGCVRVLTTETSG